MSAAYQTSSALRFLGAGSDRSAPSLGGHGFRFLAGIGENSLEIAHETGPRDRALDKHAAPVQRVGLPAYQIELG